MPSTRREFLEAAALLTGILPATRSLAEVDGGRISPADLRRRVAERRAAIHSLVIDYECNLDRPSPANGRRLLAYKRGMYRIRHEIESEGEAGIVIVTMVRGDQVLTATIVDDLVEKVAVRQRARRDPGASLETFLPGPEDKPMVSRGQREVLGERCLGVLQGDRCYWISPAQGVTRAVEVFATAETLQEATTFDDFRSLSREVLFPYRIRSTSFDEAMHGVSEMTLHVHEVTLNGPVADELFAIDRFPQAGKRVTGP